MRWRRRRFARLRRKHRKAEDHSWVNEPLVSTTTKQFELPDGIALNLQITYIVDTESIQSIRTCSMCGQESVNFESVKHSCKEEQIDFVLKS